jgi:Phospholipase_D-nuclease N-terminal
MNASPTTLQMTLALYGYLLPLLLYVFWSVLALYDVGRRPELARGAVWGWTAAVFAVPFLGALGYLLLGGSKLPRMLRMVALAGLVLYALVLLVGRGIGGIS